MATKILIKTPYFGDRPYTIEALQPLIPFTIVSLTQGSFEFTIEVAESITQEHVDAVISQMRAYVLNNLVSGEIIT